MEVRALTGAGSEKAAAPKTAPMPKVTVGGPPPQSPQRQHGGFTGAMRQ
jgi:cation/acetate symporter